MVAETIKLPNIRKMFIPDPGYVLVDADLQRADAQVVAWDAGDEELKRIFRTGADIHTENAIAIWGECDTLKRDKAKKGVHAVNYKVQAKTLASALGVSVREAQMFISGWLQAHPPIARWHERVETDLMLTRQVKNKWGFRRYYFDRIEGCVTQALGWIGQSTVAVTINKGMLNIYHKLPQIQLLIQVHDSLLMQVPKSECPDIFPEIKKAMEIVIPYDDPLVIPVTIKYSEHSWGDVKEFNHVKEKVS